jgi:hypothetical protein
MMYAGDEFYGDEITSPLHRPTYQPATRSPRRHQVKKAKRAIAKERPDVYSEYADLYDDPLTGVSNDAEDPYNRGGW